MRRFSLNNELKLVLEDNALNEIYKYEPENYLHENGGILLGKFNNEENIYVITNVSSTNLKDKKGKNFFIRNKKQAQSIINEIWRQSKGEINYLGEWHTHRENHPSPSFIDKQLVKQMINNKNVEIKNVFMVILGKRKELYVCTISNKREIEQLKEE